MKNNNKHKNLTLSLDDFGISTVANKNILKLIKSSSAQYRVSVMINGKISQKEITALKENGCKIDLHLTMSSRNPFSQKRERGIISRSFSFLKNYLGSKISSASIELEWSSQIDKFKELFGQKPDGINSHEHIHFFPAFFPASLKLADENKIGYIRFGKQELIKEKNSIYRVLNFLWHKNLDKFLSHDLDSSDQLVSLDWVRNINQFLEKNKKANIEIVCHPERKKEFELIRKYF